MSELSSTDIKLLNVLPDCALIFEIRSNRILFANENTSLAFGYSIPELLQLEVADLHPAEIRQSALDKYRDLAEGKTDTAPLLSVRTRSNRIRHFDLSGRSIIFDGKSCFLAFYRNADAVLKDLETLNRISKNALDIKKALDRSAIVAITDEKGTILDVNEKFCELSGYSTDELIGQNHRVLNSGYHPREFFVDLWRTITAGKIWHGEICNKAKNGNLYWVATTITPFMNEKGRPEQYISIRFDITSKKENEKLLRQQETDLNSIISSLEDIIFIIDEDYTFLQVWIRDPSTLFVPIDQFINKKHSEVFEKDFSSLFERNIDQVLTSGQSVYFEYPSILPGDESWYGASISKVHTRPGERKKVSMLVKDITEKRRIETRLKGSEERYRLLAENSNDWIYLLNQDKVIEFSSQSALEITGYTADELIGHSPYEYIYPHDIERVREEVRKQMEEHDWITNIEYRFIKKDGSIEWFESSGHTIYNERGAEINKCVSTRNITSRKRFSDQLAMAENIAKIGSWELNIVTNELHWSDQIYAIFELDPEQFAPSYDSFLSCVHPDDRAIVNEAYSRSVTEKTYYDITHRLLVNDVIKYVREQAITFYDIAGKPTRSVGTVQDITELHLSRLKLEQINNSLEKQVIDRTESLLQEKWERLNSEALTTMAISNYRMLFEQIPLGILVLEKNVSSDEFIFREVNSAACMIEKINKDDVSGRSLSDLYPPEKAASLLTLVNEVYTTGNTTMVPPKYFVDHNGSGWRELYLFKLVTNEIVVVINDVSEKTIGEQKLKESLLEKEFLLNEVHHRVKNNLQIIIGLMQMQSDALQDVEVVNEFIRQSENRIKALGLIHETIHETGKYTGIDIVSYIESLYVYLCKAIGKPQVQFKIESEVSEISINNASAFGIVMNEIISNALKYAFPDNSEGAINVQITANDEGRIRISIRDNGKGLPSVSRDSRGLGMKLIKGLIKQQNGTVDIVTYPSFAYTITLPTVNQIANS